MNCSVIIASLFLMGSCSKDTPTENEDLAAVEYRSRTNQKQKEQQEVFEPDLHQFFVQGQLAQLDNQRKELELEIEAGNRHLIPKWESTIRQIDQNIDLFNVVQEIICSALKKRAKYLEAEVAKGNNRARLELQEVRQKLEKCGEDASNYAEVQKARLYIIKAPPPTGGCQEPGPDFEGCKYPLTAGQLLVNAEERITRITIKTGEGRTLSEGEIIGENEHMEGFNQYLLDVPASIEQGFITISNENKGFDVPIEVTRGF